MYKCLQEESFFTVPIIAQFTFLIMTAKATRTSIHSCWTGRTGDPKGVSAQLQPYLRLDLLVVERLILWSQKVVTKHQQHVPCSCFLNNLPLVWGEIHKNMLAQNIQGLPAGQLQVGRLFRR